MVASSPSSLTTSLYKPSLVPRKAFLHLQQPGFNAGLSFSLQICMTFSSNRHLTMLMLTGTHAFLYPTPRESPWYVLWKKWSSTSLRLSHSLSQVKAATRTDPILSKAMLYTKRGWPEQGMEALRSFHHRSQELTVEDDCLFWGMRVVIPMKQAPAKVPLHPWVWPTKPWQRIHVDFAGPFLGQSFLVVVDAHSKWPEVFQMSCIQNKRVCLLHSFEVTGSTSYFLMVLECTICTNTSLIS